MWQILKISGQVIGQALVTALCVVIFACAIVTFVNYVAVILTRWTL